MQAPPAQAEDRDARLRGLGQRVVGLATGWEPDPGRAMQGLAPELAAIWGVDETFPFLAPVREDDPWSAALAYRVMLTDPQQLISEMWTFPFFTASCFRMGQPTLQDVLAIYRFEAGKPLARIDGGEVAMVDTFDSRFFALDLVALAGLADRLPGATAVLDCRFESPASGALSAQDWAALAEGLQDGFTDVGLVESADLKDRLNLGENIQVLVARAARDPSTLVAVATVGQRGDEAFGPKFPDEAGVPVALMPLEFRDVVMRLAEGS